MVCLSAVPPPESALLHFVSSCDNTQNRAFDEQKRACSRTALCSIHTRAEGVNAALRRVCLTSALWLQPLFNRVASHPLLPRARPERPAQPQGRPRDDEAEQSARTSPPLPFFHQHHLLLLLLFLLDTSRALQHRPRTAPKVLSTFSSI